MNKKDCVLSIIITAHREGLVAHKTMKSVERAVKKIEEASISYEVIVSIDRGDDQTIDYFNNYTGLPIHIYQWDHGDLSSSRNSAIKKAHGQFVSFIDADDLRRTNIAVCGMRMFFTPFSIKQQLKYQSSYPYPGLFGAYGNFLRSVIGAMITEFQRPDRTLNKISWSLVVQPVFWTIESAPSNSMV